jgi:hypothetical protein
MQIDADRYRQMQMKEKGALPDWIHGDGQSGGALF